MPTSYPGGVDSFANPTSSDDLDTVGVEHDVQHANVNDAVEALQANALLPLVYSGGAYPARPAGVAVCHYIGPTVPGDWQANDFWTDNS